MIVSSVTNFSSESPVRVGDDDVTMMELWSKPNFNISNNAYAIYNRLILVSFLFYIFKDRKAT